MSETAVAVATRRPVRPHRRPTDEPEPEIVRVPPFVLDRWVQQALRDLRNSVSAEDLPEMAVRLAQHRLLLAHRTPQQDAATHPASGQRRPRS